MLRSKAPQPRFLYPLSALFLGFALMLLGPIAPTKALELRASIALILKVEPNVHVQRGAILIYKLQVENNGLVGSSVIHAVLPYDRTKMTLLNATFENSNDWVETVDDQIKIRFGELRAEKRRSMKVTMRVSDTLPLGTVINMWAGGEWQDVRGNSKVNLLSNAAPILVGEVNETSKYSWLAVDPVAGPAGTIHNFFTDRLLPGEKTYTWLIMPNGKKVRAGMKPKVDDQGRVWFNFESKKLLPGTYNLLIEGQVSDLQAQTTFIVNP